MALPAQTQMPETTQTPVIKAVQIEGLDASTLLAEIRAIREELKELKQKIDPKDKLLTRKEAAEYLKVSVSTLRNWERIGLIKGKRIGNRVYFSQLELREVLNQKYKRNG